MIQVLTVLPCARALAGPNGFHVKAGSFVRNIFEEVERNIDFVICIRVENEPPPDILIEVYDPWTNVLYSSVDHRELEQVSPIYEVRATVAGVIMRNTGEHVFRLVVNGEPILAGPIWGYRK